MGKKVAPGSGGGLITKTDAELTSEHLRSKNRDLIKNPPGSIFSIRYNCMLFKYLLQVITRTYMANYFINFSSQDAR